MNIGIILDPHLTDKSPRARKDDYLETSLRKLEYVFEKNEKSIIVGDLFNNPSNSTYLFNRVYSLFNKYRGKIILAPPGNHDIPFRRLCDLDKTTIGSLYYTGVLDIKTESFKIDGTTFGVSLVDKSNLDSIPVDDGNEGILLGHNYYEMGLCPEESLTRDDLKRLNYKLVILGHDHSPYEELFIENSILLRVGNLMRTDTQQYNLERSIKYIQYDTVTRDYTIKTVPCDPIEEVYIDNAFSKKAQRSDINFVQIGQVLDRFKKNSEGAVSLKSALEELNTPSKCFKIIKNHYDLCGIIFS